MLAREEIKERTKGAIQKTERISLKEEQISLRKINTHEIELGIQRNNRKKPCITSCTLKQ